MNLKRINFLQYLFCLTFFIFILILNNKILKPKIFISKEQNKNTFRQNLIRYTSLGNERFSGKIIWILTLINSDIEKVKDENSWMFYNFRTISYIDPYFLANYIFAPIYLSVIKNDLEGTNFLIDKSMLYYPDHYEINFFAGIHYLFEMNDPSKAASFLERIKNHPKAPTHIKSLLARVYAQNNNPEISLEVLIEAVKNDKLPDYLKERFSQSIYALKAQIDLNCLNNLKTGNCNTTDYFGHKYLYKNGSFKAQIEWQEFKLFTPAHLKK